MPIFLKRAPILTTFEITTGAADFGWCDFTVCLGCSSWQCRASYLGEHPLCDLILSAIGLHQSIFERRVPLQGEIWNCEITAEPGGIVIQASPDDTNVRIRIFESFEDSPNPTKSPQILPVAEGLVDYWKFADAVFKDASRAVARQGFTGLRNAWQPDQWSIDFDALPIEHFLYLAALVRDRVPRKQMSLSEEIAILHDIEQVNKN